MHLSEASPLQFQNDKSSDVNFMKKCHNIKKSQIWAWHILQQDFDYQILDVFAANSYSAHSGIDPLSFKTKNFSFLEASLFTPTMSILYNFD